MKSPIRPNSSGFAAIAIAAAVVIYFLVRGVFGGGLEPNAAATRNGTEAFTVIARTMEAQEWRDVVRLRGKTEAARKVSVRAETSGVVAETPTEEGQQVTEGDVLCRLRPDARKAVLAEARAALKRATLDHDAASKLAAEGFRSDTSLAAFQAALDLARAGVEQAELDMQRIEVKAPFGGVFDQRDAEVGALLRVGDPCGVVIQRSPFLIVGGVSERDVAKIGVGDRGIAHLATGETVEGAVRFVGTAANPATRTFLVELEVPNDDGALRDGVTADFEVYATASRAHLIPRSALTLNDEGQIGVRTVKADETVEFAAVRLLGDAPEGVWVAGLDGAPNVITRGQEFVRAGQKVRVAPAEGGGAPASEAEKEAAGR